MIARRSLNLLDNVIAQALEYAKERHLYHYISFQSGSPYGSYVITQSIGNSSEYWKIHPDGKIEYHNLDWRLEDI